MSPASVRGRGSGGPFQRRAGGRKHRGLSSGEAIVSLEARPEGRSTDARPTTAFGFAGQGYDLGQRPKKINALAEPRKAGRRRCQALSRFSILFTAAISRWS